MAHEPLWSPVDVAAYVGVPVKTVYLWVSDGRLSAYRVGRHLRFFPSEVRAYVESQKLARLWAAYQSALMAVIGRGTTQRTASSDPEIFSVKPTRSAG